VPALLVTLLLLSGCNPKAPQLVQRPPAQQPASAAPILGADTPCSHPGYGFTCVAPPGFLITEEQPGPGKILTLVGRSRTSREESTLTVRAHALKGGNKLKWLIDEKIYKPAKKASNVKDLQMAQASMGSRPGFLVSMKRSYATGGYTQRFFCFERDGIAFVVEHVFPGQLPAKGKDILDAFVSSLSFR